MTLLHFYSRSQGSSAAAADALASAVSEVASSTRHVLKVGAVDCDRESAICNVHKVDSLPAIHVRSPLVRCVGVLAADSGLLLDWCLYRVGLKFGQGLA